MGDGGVARAAHLDAVEGLAVDAGGNLYLSDAGAHRIRRVTAAGRITTVVGDGFGGFAGDGGAAALARVRNPYGIAFDRLGRLLIADFGNSRVRRVEADGRITTVIGPEWLKGPRGLAVDFAGNVFVADALANRVLRLAVDGRVTVAMDGLAFPVSVAVDYRGQVFVADSGTKSVRMLGSVDRIEVPGTPSAVVSDLMGNLTVATVEGGLFRLGPERRFVRAEMGGSLGSLRALFLDGAGTLFLSQGGMVSALSPMGKLEAVAGGAAAVAESAHQLRLAGPMGLALGLGGELYVVDEPGRRVWRIEPDGRVDVAAGTGEAGRSGDGGQAKAAKLGDPVAVAISPFGELAIADYEGHRVRVVLPDGTIYRAAGTGEAGAGGEGGPGTYAQLNKPRGVAYDARGDLYIADSGSGRILKLSRGGILTNVPVKATLSNPAGVAFDGDGGMWIADAGNGRVILPDGTSVGGLEFPVGIAADGNGGAIITDTYRHTVKRIGADGGVTLLAGTGARGYGGDGRPALEAQFDAPVSVAVGAEGRIFVCDSGNGRVRVLTPVAGAVAPVASGPIEKKLVVLHAASRKEALVAAGQLAVALGEHTAIEVGGERAVVLQVRDGETRFVVPRGLKPGPYEAVSGDWRGGVAVVEASPAFFVYGDGTLNPDGAAIPRGSVVALYAAGVNAEMPVSVRVGSAPAEIVWQGDAPGLPGVWQVNVRLPGIFSPPGRQTVVLRQGAFESPGVSITLE